MRFTFNGKTYEISFERHGGVIPDRTITMEVEEDTCDGTMLVEKQMPIPTRHPYTTVRVYEVVDPEAKGKKGLKEIRSATVGAHFREVFTLEKGRINALRALFPSKTKFAKGKNAGEPTEDHHFKAAVWKSYLGRRG